MGVRVKIPFPEIEVKDYFHSNTLVDIYLITVCFFNSVILGEDGRRLPTFHVLLDSYLYLFRIVEAEWPQCRRCQALSYWGSGNLEWVG